MHIIRKLELETESGPKSIHSDFMGVKHSKWGRAIKTCLKNILNSHKFFQVVHVIFCRTANDLIWILEHYWKILVGQWCLQIFQFYCSSGCLNVELYARRLNEIKAEKL